MQIEGNKVRTKKLKLAFKKAVTESLNPYTTIKSILTLPSPNDSLSILDEHSSVAVTDQQITEFVDELRNAMYDAFKKKCNEFLVCDKLDNLDRLVRLEKNVYRDVKAPAYVKEVFESYIVDKKIDLNAQIEIKSGEAKNRKNDVKKRIEEVEDCLTKIKKENEEMEFRYKNLIKQMKEM